MNEGVLVWCWNSVWGVWMSGIGWDDWVLGSFFIE